MRRTLAICIAWGASLATAWGQQGGVPSTLAFADVQLRLTPAARQEIQGDVDALVNGGKYFQAKADRARMYMPIVEQILREEGVPEDFKYLAIQESAFIPDAVSVSNAVGFWQFKEPSAMEVGLLINRQVDERMNIVAATRGACRYLKKFNETFDNWWYSLQAYNNGLSGAQQVLPRSGYGSQSVSVSTEAHWYVKKYLAHRLAYEQAVEPIARPEQLYVLYETKGGESLAELSRQLKVEEEVLKGLNVWLKAHRVPTDKTYYVVYPTDNPMRQEMATMDRQEMDEDAVALPSASDQEEYPRILADARVSNQPFRITINGRRAIVAGRYDDINTLAVKVDVLPATLRGLNDMEAEQPVIPGQYYYLEPKRNRARVYYHTVQPGETLWQISQKYGVKLSKLVQKNRLDSPKEIAPGMVLWLRFIRPADMPVQYEEDRKATGPEIEHNEEMIASAMEFLEAQEEVESELPAARNQPATMPPVMVRDTVEANVPEEGIPVIDPLVETLPTTDEESLEEENLQPADTVMVDTASQMEPSRPAQILYPGASSVQVVQEDSVSAEVDSVEVEIPMAADAEEQEEVELARDTTTQTVSVSETMSQGDSVRQASPAANPIVQTDSTPSLSLEEVVQPSQTSPDPVSETPAQAAPRWHVVQQGETLYSLSRTYQVSVSTLIRANELDPNQPIAIDQKLIIPSDNGENEENHTSTVTPEGDHLHVVQAGETMYAIARRYDVRVEDLRAWNNKPDYTLKVGEKLVIKR